MIRFLIIFLLIRPLIVDAQPGCRSKIFFRIFNSQDSTIYPLISDSISKTSFIQDSLYYETFKVKILNKNINKDLGITKLRDTLKGFILEYSLCDLKYLKLEVRLGTETMVVNIINNNYEYKDIIIDSIPFKKGTIKYDLHDIISQNYFREINLSPYSCAIGYIIQANQFEYKERYNDESLDPLRWHETVINSDTTLMTNLDYFWYRSRDNIKPEFEVIIDKYSNDTIEISRKLSGKRRKYELIHFENGERSYLIRFKYKNSKCQKKINRQEKVENMKESLRIKKHDAFDIPKYCLDPPKVKIKKHFDFIENNWVKNNDMDYPFLKFYYGVFRQYRNGWFNNNIIEEESVAE